MNQENQENNKHNWKLFIGALIAITVVGLTISGIMELPPRTTVYCQFNSSIEDAVPRQQCGYNVNVHEFEKFGRCNENLEVLPDCEGDTYHLSKFRLQDLCDGEECSIDGVACNAFFITYYNESDPDRQELESLYFSKANLPSEEVLMSEFNKCSAPRRGPIMPWQ